MQFPVKTGAPVSNKTACAILPLFDGGPLSGATKDIDKATGGLIRRMVQSGNASGRIGRAVFVHQIQPTAAESLLLIGCGPRKGFERKQFCAAHATAAQALRDTGIREAVTYLGYAAVAKIDAYYAARLTVETFRTGLYRFDELKSRSESTHKLSRLGIAVSVTSEVRESRRGVTDGSAIANGMDLARDLGNRPPNKCTPTHLANTAREIAKSYDNIDAKILGEREVKRLGMGALLAVTCGAEEPVRFIVLSYRGAASKSAPIVLCGKGITFDTGGISLKPPPKMDEMKFDMCGAAGVLGTMRSLGELQPEVNVVAIIPAAENMPGGRATRPGDIVTSLSGQTIEILNTDAEGRLILSDALTYAQRFKPRYLLDVATLTGACVVALGPLYTGLFCNDEDLAAAILAASERSRDAVWRMPVDDEYGESLKSNFADFANAGSRDGGASVAAQFLSRFVEGQAWAHLDIAGVAWHSNQNKGATGRPVALLIDFLLNI